MQAAEHIFNPNHKDKRLIVSEEEPTLEQLHQILSEKFSLKFKKIFGEGAIASDDPDNPNYAIIMPRYNETQLDILEDCYDYDWTANQAIQKQANLIVGREARTTLICLNQYANEKERNEELTIINDDPRFKTSKSEIDKYHETVESDFINNITKAIKSCSTYGRAAIQIGKIDKLTGLPKSLKKLNSRRLGRVKVEKETNKIIAVEYLDLKVKSPGGDTEPTDDQEKFIPIDQLIYFTNDDGDIATNSQFTGISRLESIINISQVKRIIMNQNIKESAKTHYAGILIAQFPEEIETSTMTNWISSAAKSAGRWFAHKLQVGISHFKVDTDLAQYGNLVELIDRAEIRAIGIPAHFLGYEEINTYASAEQVNNGYAEGELPAYRNVVKRTLKKYYLSKLFHEYLKNPILDKKVEEAKALEEKKQKWRDAQKAKLLAKSKKPTPGLEGPDSEPNKPPNPTPQPPDPNNPLIPNPDKTDEPNPDNEAGKTKKTSEEEPPSDEEGIVDEGADQYNEEDITGIIPDEDVDLSIDFKDITFQTRKESVESLQIVQNMGVELPDELILEVAGLGEYKEAIVEYKQSKVEEKLEKANKELMAVKMGANQINADATNPAAVKNPFNPSATNKRPEDKSPLLPPGAKPPTTAATAESSNIFDDYLANKGKNESLATAEYIATLKSLQNKIESIK